ncbi:MAG: AMP-binding protein, partial [Planctomycetota bacterium]
MNICESITVTSKLFPDRTALVFEDQHVSYRELNNATALAALVLRDAGVQSGDRVALMLPNAPCFPIWYYAALRIGGIAVSISTRLSASEVEFVASDCEPKVFIANEDAISVIGNPNPQSVSKCLGVDEFSGLPNGLNEWGNANDFQPDQCWDANPEDPALILYTSGTTGFPKGATLSHGNVRSNVHAFNHLCNMRPDDSVLLAVPLFHCFGQNALLNSVLNVGGKLVLQSRFDLNYSKDLIQQHAVNQLYGVPMMFGLLHESCSVEELGTVDYCFSAAATLPNQIEDAWFDKFGIPIHQGYGLTETSPFATYNHRLKFRSGSIGTPIDSVEIKVVDVETGHRCNVGRLGEIAIKGPNVMLGYWNRPDETEQAIRDGWFYSGDIGRLDEDGYLFIVDRVKDMITVGGLKVFPAEVERVLLDSPIIRQVAVIGVPDSVFGEQVIAYVVLTEDAPDSAITLVEQYAKQFLGNYKLPRRIVLVEELPRNASGKILKTKLREMAADNLSQSDSGAESVTPSNLKPPTLRNRIGKDCRLPFHAVSFLVFYPTRSSATLLPTR